MSTEHEGLRAAYRDYRAFCYSDARASERRLRLIKKSSVIKRLNTILDLGAKL